jgi:hypothetical protein
MAFCRVMPVGVHYGEEPQIAPFGRRQLGAVRAILGCRIGVPVTSTRHKIRIYYLAVEKDLELTY